MKLLLLIGAAAAAGAAALAAAAPAAASPSLTTARPSNTCRRDADCCNVEQALADYANNTVAPAPQSACCGGINNACDSGAAMTCALRDWLQTTTSSRGHCGRQPCVGVQCFAAPPAAECVRGTCVKRRVAGDKCTCASASPPEACTAVVPPDCPAHSDAVTECTVDSQRTCRSPCFSSCRCRHGGDKSVFSRFSGKTCPAPPAPPCTEDCAANGRDLCRRLIEQCPAGTHSTRPCELDAERNMCLFKEQCQQRCTCNNNAAVIGTPAQFRDNSVSCTTQTPGCHPANTRPVPAGQCDKGCCPQVRCAVAPQPCPDGVAVSDPWRCLGNPSNASSCHNEMDDPCDQMCACKNDASKRFQSSKLNANPALCAASPPRGCHPANTKPVPAGQCDKGCCPQVRCAKPPTPCPADLAVSDPWRCLGNPSNASSCHNEMDNVCEQMCKCKSSERRVQADKLAANPALCSGDEPPRCGHGQGPALGQCHKQCCPVAACFAPPAPCPTEVSESVAAHCLAVNSTTCRSEVGLCDGVCACKSDPSKRIASSKLSADPSLCGSGNGGGECTSCDDAREPACIKIFTPPCPAGSTEVGQCKKDANGSCAKTCPHQRSCKCDASGEVFPRSQAAQKTCGSGGGDDECKRCADAPAQACIEIYTPPCPAGAVETNTCKKDAAGRCQQTCAHERGCKCTATGVTFARSEAGEKKCGDGGGGELGPVGSPCKCSLASDDLICTLELPPPCPKHSSDVDECDVTATRGGGKQCTARCPSQKRCRCDVALPGQLNRPFERNARVSCPAPGGNTGVGAERCTLPPSKAYPSGYKARERELVRTETCNTCTCMANGKLGDCTSYWCIDTQRCATKWWRLTCAANEDKEACATRARRALVDVLPTGTAAALPEFAGADARGAARFIVALPCKSDGSKLSASVVQQANAKLSAEQIVVEDSVDDPTALTDRPPADGDRSGDGNGGGLPTGAIVGIVLGLACCLVVGVALLVVMLRVMAGRRAAAPASSYGTQFATQESAYPAVRRSSRRSSRATSLHSTSTPGNHMYGAAPQQ